ncbi:MAG: TolC family protein [Bacteroidota bacterium]
MNSKTRITTTLILLFTFSTYFLAYAQPGAQIWTLQECVNYALENNLTIQNQELTLGIYDVNSKQAKMNYLPSLNASGQYGRNWGRSINPGTNTVTQLEQDNGFASLSLNWILFSGLRNINTVKQSNADLMVGQYSLEKSRNDITLLIVTYYTNVIFNKELFENAKSQLESTTHQLERTSKQVEAGSLPRSALLEMQAQAASGELNVINTENAVNLSYLQLKQVMQIPASEHLEIEIPEIELSEADLADLNPDKVYEIAEATMPEIKGADKNIESSILGVKVAQSSYYPRVTLGAGLNTNYSSIAAERGRYETTGNILETPIGYVQTSGDIVVMPTDEIVSIPLSTGRQLEDNFGQSVGIGISIPIFNNLQVNAGVQRAKIAQSQAEILAEQTRQTLRQTIEMAYNDVYSSGKAFQSSLKRVEAQEEAFRAMKQRFENGAVNATEYELAENNLFQAKSDLLRAKYNYIFKLKVLDFYQGKTIDF